MNNNKNPYQPTMPVIGNGRKRFNAKPDLEHYKKMMEDPMSEAARKPGAGLAGFAAAALESTKPKAPANPNSPEQLDQIYGPQSDLTQYSPQTQARLLAAKDATEQSLTPPLAESMPGSMRPGLDQRLDEEGYLQQSSEDNKTDTEQLGFSTPSSANNDQNNGTDDKKAFNIQQAQNVGGTVNGANTYGAYHGQVLQNRQKAADEQARQAADAQSQRDANDRLAAFNQKNAQAFQLKQQQPVQVSYDTSGQLPGTNWSNAPQQAPAGGAGIADFNNRLQAAYFKPQYNMSGVAVSNEYGADNVQRRNVAALPSYYQTSDANAKKEAYELGKKHQQELLSKEYSKDDSAQQKDREIAAMVAKADYAPSKANAPPSGVVHPPVYSGDQSTPPPDTREMKSFDRDHQEAAQNGADMRNFATTLSMLTNPYQTPGLLGGTLTNDLRSSDERNKEKEPIDHKSELDNFFSNLKAYQFRYKDENSPGASPGIKVGVMAQDLEKSPVGKQAVIDTPDGKMVNFGKLIPITIAEQAYQREHGDDQDSRLDRLEELLNKHNSRK